MSGFIRLLSLFATLRDQIININIKISQLLLAVSAFHLCMFYHHSKHSYRFALHVFLTCTVMSHPSSRLSRTDEPLSRSSTSNSASCRILCSCGRQPHVHVNICTTINCSCWHTVKNPLCACVPMRNACCLSVVSHRGQSDNQNNKNYTFIPLMWACSPGKMASDWIYSLCESHTCWMSRVRLSEILDKCTVGLFPASAHLLDPFRFLQNFKEGVFRVSTGGAGSAGSQQLFEWGLNLSCFCKFHRHQFTVQTRVQSKALCQRQQSNTFIFITQINTNTSSNLSQLHQWYEQHCSFLVSKIQHFLPGFNINDGSSTQHHFLEKLD